MVCGEGREAIEVLMRRNENGEVSECICRRRRRKWESPPKERGVQSRAAASRG